MKDFNFKAWRKEAEKYYSVNFPNIKADERRKLIDNAENIKRQKYTAA